MTTIYRAKFDGDGFLAGMYPDDVWPLMVADQARPIYEGLPDPSWVAADHDPDDDRPTIQIVRGYEEMPNPKLPDGLVDITEEQYQDLLANPGRRKWDDGEIVEFVPPPPPPVSLLNRPFLAGAAPVLHCRLTRS